MHYMLDAIYDRACAIRDGKTKQKCDLTDRIGKTEDELMSITREMKLKIHNMVEEVEQKVSKALNEEIWRLGNLVDEFSLPFHTEPLVLNVYKKEINAHVENGLGSNLRSRLSTALAMNIETAQREMTGTCEAFLLIVDTLDSNFSLLFRTNARARTARQHQHQEQTNSDTNATIRNVLHTQLSESVLRLSRRSGIQILLGHNRYDSAFHRQSKGQIEGIAIQYECSVVTTAIESDCQRWTTVAATADFVDPSNGHLAGSNISHLAVCNGIDRITGHRWRSTRGWLRKFYYIFACEYYYRRNLLIFVYFLFDFQLLKTIGWRVLVGVGALYGCVYFYERVSWTNSAKEKTFKNQYVQHATRKLKLIVDLTSANCSHQVQQ